MSYNRAVTANWVQIRNVKSICYAMRFLTLVIIIKTIEFMCSIFCLNKCKMIFKAPPKRLCSIQSREWLISQELMSWCPSMCCLRGAIFRMLSSKESCLTTRNSYLWSRTHLPTKMRRMIWLIKRRKRTKVESAFPAQMWDRRITNQFSIWWTTSASSWTNAANGPSWVWALPILAPSSTLSTNCFKSKFSIYFTSDFWFSVGSSIPKLGRNSQLKSAINYTK